MSEERSLFKQILTWTVVGIVAVMAIKLAFGLLGMAFGLVSFLLFTVGPVLLVGWLAMKGWKAFAREPVRDA